MSCSAQTVKTFAKLLLPATYIAKMVADMEVDKVAGMVADMEVDILHNGHMQHRYIKGRERQSQASVKGPIPARVRGRGSGVRAGGLKVGVQRAPKLLVHI